MELSQDRAGRGVIQGRRGADGGGGQIWGGGGRIRVRLREGGRSVVKAVAKESRGKIGSFASVTEAGSVSVIPHPSSPTTRPFLVAAGAPATPVRGTQHTGRHRPRQHVGGTRQVTGGGEGEATAARGNLLGNSRHLVKPCHLHFTRFKLRGRAGRRVSK